MNKSLLKKIEKANQLIKKMLTMVPQDKIVIAWTGGKDSTVLLHIIRSHFKGEVPFTVMFNDSTMEFEEIYEFIEYIKKEWHLSLLVEKHASKDLTLFNKENKISKKKLLSRMMKVNAIKNFLKKHKTKAFVVGIRRDEHSARSQEVYFSKREGHIRVHPILDFTEKDIWNYIKTFKVPFVSLYSQGYRSLGEKPFTEKVKPGGEEREGREYDKESTMEKLRSLGYW